MRRQIPKPLAPTASITDAPSGTTGATMAARLLEGVEPAALATTTLGALAFLLQDCAGPDARILAEARALIAEYRKRRGLPVAGGGQRIIERQGAV